MGERAVDKQLVGKTPTARDVRVDAYSSPDTRAGSGAHEFYPTDRRGDAVKNPELIPYQSGARSRTDRTYFRNDTGDVIGHTGAFPKTTGRGSTHTTGQKGAHDRERDFKPKGKTGNHRNLERFTHQISGFATGQDILDADSITGAHPNLKGSAPLEDPSATTKPNRKRAALEQHNRREKTKRRLDEMATSKGLPRPSSPPRERPGGPGGGGYTYDVQGPPSPLPSFPETDPVKREADEFGWLSAPFRIDSEYQTSKECRSCRMLNDNRASTCFQCGNAL
jgi:hypothetical protein